MSTEGSITNQAYSSREALKESSSEGVLTLLTVGVKEWAAEHRLKLNLKGVLCVGPLFSRKNGVLGVSKAHFYRFAGAAPQGRRGRGASRAGAARFTFTVCGWICVVHQVARNRQKVWVI